MKTRFCLYLAMFLLMGAATNAQSLGRPLMSQPTLIDVPPTIAEIACEHRNSQLMIARRDLLDDCPTRTLRPLPDSSRSELMSERALGMTRDREIRSLREEARLKNWFLGVAFAVVIICIFLTVLALEAARQARRDMRAAQAQLEGMRIWNETQGAYRGE